MSVQKAEAIRRGAEYRFIPFGKADNQFTVAARAFRSEADKANLTTDGGIWGYSRYTPDYDHPAERGKFKRYIALMIRVLRKHKL